MRRHARTVPELLEVEIYRRLAVRTLGRPIVGVDAPDAWFLKGGLTGEQVTGVLVGRSFATDRRTGKLLLLDLSDDPRRPSATLGLRFGMTGRLLVDGGPIEALTYGSNRDVPAWDRFSIRFADGGALRVRDPRRLGGIELDPDESRLGVDATAVSASGLAAVLRGSEAPVKARLMDQSRIAGLGNLLTDETLWRAGLDPARRAGSLTPADVRRLHRHLRTTLEELGRRGGSHLGDLMTARVRGGTCPRDTTPLLRRTVAGRTTYSCPRHQR